MISWFYHFTVCGLWCFFFVCVIAPHPKRPGSWPLVVQPKRHTAALSSHRAAEPRVSRVTGIPPGLTMSQRLVRSAIVAAGCCAASAFMPPPKAVSFSSSQSMLGHTSSGELIPSTSASSPQGWQCCHATCSPLLLHCVLGTRRGIYA